MSDPDFAEWVVLGGASGHAFSAHYNDQTQTWLDGGLHDWPFTRDAVQRSADDVLVLRPDPAAP
jgi:penicillin amidase